MENTEENKNNSTEKCKEQYCRYCRYCCVLTEESIHSRRCFMTGEYCSQQENIRYEREKLHKNNHISAFVIMNFSHMSDILYHWRLSYFIESLSQYLYFDKKKEKLYCHSSEKAKKVSDDIGEELEPVKKIHVSRSDSDLASNYVTCTRICQQMQIADLIIVDVSSQNANVFYELGMAVAFGKLILPICYSESYYKSFIPDELKKNSKLYRKVEHHIGCFPWRKNLFEYYGIQYRRWTEENLADDKDKTRYMNFDIITSKKYGFSDIKYNRFPYHEKVDGKHIGRTI